MLIPALSESQIMTDTYTDAIWDSYVDKDKNITFRDNFYNDLKNYYNEIVILMDDILKSVNQFIKNKDYKNNC